MNSLFSFLFFFFIDGTTCIGEEKCASLYVSKNCDNFLSQFNLNTLCQVSRNQKADQRLYDLKKKKNVLSSDNSWLFFHNWIIAPKPTRKGQESTNKTRLHL